MLIRDPPLIRWSIHAPNDGFLNHRASSKYAFFHLYRLHETLSGHEIL